MALTSPPPQHDSPVDVLIYTHLRKLDKRPLHQYINGSSFYHRAQTAYELLTYVFQLLLIIPCLYWLSFKRRLSNRVGSHLIALPLSHCLAGRWGTSGLSDAW
jgi:hypothetical protein